MASQFTTDLLIKLMYLRQVTGEVRLSDLTGNTKSMDHEISLYYLGSRAEPSTSQNYQRSLKYKDKTYTHLCLDHIYSEESRYHRYILQVHEGINICNVIKIVYTLKSNPLNEDKMIVRFLTYYYLTNPSLEVTADSILVDTLSRFQYQISDSSNGGKLLYRVVSTGDVMEISYRDAITLYETQNQHIVPYDNRSNTFVKVLSHMGFTTNDVMDREKILPLKDVQSGGVYCDYYLNPKKRLWIEEARRSYYYESNRKVFNHQIDLLRGEDMLWNSDNDALLREIKDAILRGASQNTIRDLMVRRFGEEILGSLWEEVTRFY